MSQAFNATYKFRGQTCESLAQLGVALASDWDHALEHFERGYIDQWVEKDLKDYDLKIEIDKIRSENESQALQLFLLIRRLSPEQPACYRGITIDKETLLSIAQNESDQACQFFNELYSRKILTMSDVSPEEPFFSNLDSTWRREVEQYFSHSKKFFTYRDVWKDHSALAARMLRENPSEMLIQLSEENYDSAVTLVNHSAKHQIFRPIIEAVLSLEESIGEGGLESGAPLSNLANVAPRSFWTEEYTPEPFNADKDLAKCKSWVNDLTKESDESLGRFVLLRKVISPVADRVKGELKAIEEFEKTTEPFGRKFLNVPLETAVIAAAVVMIALVLSGLVTSREWVVWFGVAIVLLLAFAPIPQELRSAPTDMVGKKLLAISGAGGLAFMLVAVAQEMNASFVEGLGMFAVSGFLAILLFWGRQKELRKIRSRRIEQMNSALYGTSEKLPHKEVLERMDRVLNPNRGSSSDSVDQSTGHSNHLSNVPPQTSTDDSSGSRKSGPSVSHGDGYSTTIAGYSIGSDGTITTPLSRNVSIDSKGGLNTRVTDNVTIHSDGKYTTKLWDGFEVRSDGQVSTDFLGIRVSRGGKSDSGKKKGFSDFWG